MLSEWTIHVSRVVQYCLIKALVVAEFLPDVGDIMGPAVLLAGVIKEGLGVADEDKVVVGRESGGEELGCLVSLGAEAECADGRA